MALPAPRSGVLARKVGMTRVFDESGRHVPVTVLSARLLACALKKSAP